MVELDSRNCGGRRGPTSPNISPAGAEFVLTPGVSLGESRKINRVPSGDGTFSRTLQKSSPKNLLESNHRMRDIRFFQPGDFLGTQLQRESGDGVVEVLLFGSANNGRGDDRLVQ